MRGFGFPACAQRRQRAHLREAEADPEQGVGYFRVLVETGGHADRIGDMQPKGIDAQQRIVGSAFERRHGLQRGDGHAMRRLGVEAVQQRQREPAERPDEAAQAQIMSSGN